MSPPADLSFDRWILADTTLTYDEWREAMEAQRDQLAFGRFLPSGPIHPCDAPFTGVVIGCTYIGTASTAYADAFRDLYALPPND